MYIYLAGNTLYLLWFNIWASLVAQLVKNQPAMWENWVRSLGWGDLLENGTATHSSILIWIISGTVESTGSQRVAHDWMTFTFTSTILGTAEQLNGLIEMCNLFPPTKCNQFTSLFVSEVLSRIPEFQAYQVGMILSFQGLTAVN